MNKIIQPVFPIPVFFDANQALDCNATEEYLKYLKSYGVNLIMTTAGTSQFNLLSNPEIRDFNYTCVHKFSDKECIIALPELPTLQMENELSCYNIWYNEFNNFAVLAIYPERFYNDESIKSYFYNLADKSKAPVYIHGMFLRHYKSGLYDYSAELINELKKHENIIGIKEEASNFNTAYDVCSNICSDDFNVIVAGGSQKRFMLLQSTGATSFLSGIGSIFPNIDMQFFNLIKTNNLIRANKIVNNIEKPFFDVFMEIGWHRSLKAGLFLSGISNSPTIRDPFPKVSNIESLCIRKVLELVKERYHDM